MAIVNSNFIPELWAAALLEELETSLVYAGPEIVNSDYEGDIREKGSKVHIVSPGAPNEREYVPGTPLVYEQPSDTEQVLEITEARYSAWKMNDILRKQQNPGMLQAWASSAKTALAKRADSFISSKYVEVAPGNHLGTVAILTPEIADFKLVDMGVVLDNNDVPDDGRWVVIPPWYHGLLEKNPTFVDASKSNDPGILRNGFIGTARRFKIFKSNTTPFPGGDDNIIIAGYKGAITFAQQIPVGEVETLRSESDFADLMRILHLYGGEVIRPDKLAVMQASIT
ncbi:MAG: hypothetical protein ACRDSF_00090 [Pseudonocardiaceae bacterium]